MMMRIVVTGATGFIGRALVGTLLTRGDDVLILTRRPDVARRILGEGIKVVPWRVEYDPAWGETIEGYDAVVNLAGEPLVGRRWTDKQKDCILKSRTEATDGIIKAIRRADHRPEVLVNASGIGYYGPCGDEELTEDSPPGDGFTAEVCRAWEEAVEDDDTESVRTVRVRIGLVLGHGGALPRMIKPYNYFMGGPYGVGRQWVSWIHLFDLIGIILLALENPRIEGPLNGTAPRPVTNRDFAHTLGRVLGRPAGLPTPAFALRLALGEMADVLLTGQRVLPRHALRMGYLFRFTTLADALQEILKPAG